MRKTVFNIETGEVVIHYHFVEGQIFKKPKTYSRQELISQGKSGDMNEKDTDETKEQQEFKQINMMEQRCHAQIKQHEKNAGTERDTRRDKEKLIHQ
jgi:hypothetical protein